MSVRNSLREILKAAGEPESRADELAVTGEDPVFPTPYRVGTAGAAAIGAVGLAVADLWFLRTGRKQQASIGVRAAAAAMRSAHYLAIDGSTPRNPWAPMSGYYPVRDGRWISIHCNFPDHRDAALRVLGTGEDRAAAEAASRTWDGVELESALHAAGGCAGLSRSAEEWATHPHAAAVAGQPLIEIQKLSEAEPEPLPQGSRPLSGIRALDLTRVLAGPTCARTLAEHGADVLKITAAHLADSGQTDFDTGLGKLSAQLDLRNAPDRDKLRDLAREADVFSQSYRPGTLAAGVFRLLK
jgi:crotonobetainyl-CoA:carnitine CoA-transferase CaiB-like acyl-CoA transferase